MMDDVDGSLLLPLPLPLPHASQGQGGHSKECGGADVAGTGVSCPQCNEMHQGTGIIEAIRVQATRYTRYSI